MTLQGQIKPISLQGSINVVPNEGGAGGPLQEKTVYPSHDEQIITPDEDFYGLSLVKIKPVPRLPFVEATVSTDPFLGPNLVEKVINLSVGVETTQPSGVSYYYNRELLPETPPEVAGCPYLVIVRSLTDSRLYASFNKPYVYTRSDGTVRLQIPAGGYVRCQYNSSHNVWLADKCDEASIYLNMHGAGGWVVWWSNFDIPDGSADAEETFWYGSEPTVEQPADAEFFYYNGKLLPKIPEGIESEYPYMFIPNSGSGEPVLYAFSTIPYWYPTTTYPTCMKASGAGVQYNFSESENAWVFTKNHASMYGIFANGIAWANYNIPNGSETATAIYLYGTLAVPDPTE